MRRPATLDGYSVNLTNTTDQGANPYKRLNKPTPPTPRCICPYPECKATWHICWNND